MDILFFILIGVTGGILAGMGMGGGTLLIPMLTILMGVEQHLSQAINLIAFIPMAIIAIIIHRRNSLINFKLALPILITGLFGSGIGALIANNTEAGNLKVYFGIFLLSLGIFQIMHLIIEKKHKTNS